jgi:predicted N-acetyltransferase YhbS
VGILASTNGLDSAVRRAGLESVYSEAGDAFMVIELAADVLKGRTGVVEYPDEFEGV